MSDAEERRYTVQEFLLTYMSWLSLMQRCVYRGNRKDASLYRDRGIKVCDRWLKFENFIKDVGPRPSKELTLDRFPNNDGNYEPDNVRWATALQQAANTRSVSLLEFRGEKRPIADWARRTGIKRATIQVRLKLGWSVDDALTIPMSERNAGHVSFAEGRVAGKKLTAEQVAELVTKARTGRYTARRLGTEYGVSGVAIGHVLKQFGVRMKKGRPRL